MAADFKLCADIQLGGGIVETDKNDFYPLQNFGHAPLRHELNPQKH
jgi:hypothetical protein